MELSLAQLELTLTKYCSESISIVSSLCRSRRQDKEDIIMSKLIPGNQKHLTLDDRLYIQKSLDEGLSFKDISKFLCKDPTTISKEVRLHRSTNTWNKGSFTNPYNFCVHRFRCKRTNVCEKLFICDQKCASCHRCNQVCKRFEKEQCNRLDKAPYVCNGCPKQKHRCTIPHKYDYDAHFAQRKYEELRTSSREGINKTRAQVRQMNGIIKPLVMQGQSPYHILTNHPELDVSVKTLYNYINQGVLLTRNIDLKRKPKFKPRKTEQTRITNREVFNGRTYQDFQALNPEHFAEMDTVISAKGADKCILTFFLPDSELFLAYLLNRRTAGAVRAVFDRLEKALDTYRFLTLFEVILTDRGSEFGDPESLETGIDGLERTSIYYCDPMCSGQKGGIEQVHTMLRMILPKGTVFTDLTQWDLRKVVNHINSTPRKKLEGRTPYQVAAEHYGEDVLNALQLRPIPPDDVTLTPKLLKK